MILASLPIELQQLIGQYLDREALAAAAWSNTKGSVAENAESVRKSDKYAEEAEGLLQQIQAYCAAHGLVYTDVYRHMTQ